MIIKEKDNDLSFITNSLHCKENIYENKSINILKGAYYEQRGIYPTLQRIIGQGQGIYQGFTN